MDIKGISSLDSTTQSDIDNLIYENGIDALSMLTYHDPIYGYDNPMYTFCPQSKVRGNGKPHTIKNGYGPIMSKDLPKPEADYDKRFSKCSVRKKLTIAKEWAYRTGKPFSDSAMNSYGEHQLIVMYLLFHGKLTQTYSNIRRIEELYEYLFECYKDPGYRAYLHNRAILRKCNAILSGKQVFSGGLINDDLIDPSKSPSTPIFVNTALDIIMCCKYTNDFNDVYDRVLFMLDRFRSTYDKKLVIRTSTIELHSNLKYFIVALYCASKFAWENNAHKYGFRQMDRIYYSYGITYGGIDEEISRYYTYVTPFYQVIDRWIEYGILKFDLS